MNVHIHQMNENGAVDALIDNRFWTAGWTQAKTFSVEGDLFLFLLKRNGGRVDIHKILQS